MRLRGDARATPEPCVGVRSTSVRLRNSDTRRRPTNSEVRPPCVSGTEEVAMYQPCTSTAVNPGEQRGTRVTRNQTLSTSNCGPTRCGRKLRSWAHNPKVAGSNPAPATNNTRSEALSARGEGLRRWRTSRSWYMAVLDLVHVPRSFALRPGQRLGFGRCARRSPTALRSVGQTCPVSLEAHLGAPRPRPSDRCGRQSSWISSEPDESSAGCSSVLS